MGKIGVGVIGLGRIAPRHINDSIDEIEELELVAVCDIDQKKIERYYERNVPFYRDYRDLINDKAVEVVVVATPNGLHTKIAKSVADVNKHCVLEKPIAIDYESAKELISRFEKSKGILFPVLQVRFNPVIQAIKEIVLANKLGKIFSATLTIRWTRPQEYFDSSNWKGTKEMDGGSLLTQAIHYIDATQYILGQVASVFGKVDTEILNIETEDTAKALINFKDGFRGLIEFTVSTYPHNLESSLMIMGSKGTVKIGGKAMNELELWEVNNEPKPEIDKGLSPNVYNNGEYTGSCPNHSLIYQNLVDVLLHNDDQFIKASDALHAIKIIDSIKKSSAENRLISI